MRQLQLFYAETERRARVARAEHIEDLRAAYWATKNDLNSMLRGLKREDV